MGLGRLQLCQNGRGRAWGREFTARAVSCSNESKRKLGMNGEAFSCASALGKGEYLAQDEVGREMDKV